MKKALIKIDKTEDGRIILSHTKWVYIANTKLLFFSIVLCLILVPLGSVNLTSKEFAQGYGLIALGLLLFIGALFVFINTKKVTCILNEKNNTVEHICSRLTATTRKTFNFSDITDINIIENIRYDLIDPEFYFLFLTTYQRSKKKYSSIYHSVLYLLEIEINNSYKYILTGDFSYNNARYIYETIHLYLGLEENVSEEKNSILPGKT